MASLELRELTTADVPAAGRLLAERHRVHRLVEPLLSPSYEDRAIAAAEVATALASDDASGAVAVRGDEVIGYLVGAPKAVASWGPNVWVESAGCAVVEGEAEVIRDLYAFAARRWVADGRIAHYVLAPSHDRAGVDAWFRLGFGHQHTHGIQKSRPVSLPSGGGLVIRRAVREDIPVLARLDLELPEHQGLSPVFSSGPTPTLEEAEREWDDDFDDEDFTVLVAESGGLVVGSAIACAIEKSSLHTGPARPADAGFLGFAAVVPEARGLGAGRALGEAVISWSADAGYSAVVTDWRETNLLSSRTWPRLGFGNTFVRLHRVVGY